MYIKAFRCLSVICVKIFFHTCLFWFCLLHRNFYFRRDALVFSFGAVGLNFMLSIFLELGACDILPFFSYWDCPVLLESLALNKHYFVCEDKLQNTLPAFLFPQEHSWHIYTNKLMFSSLLIHLMGINSCVSDWVAWLTSSLPKKTRKSTFIFWINNHWEMAVFLSCVFMEMPRNPPLAFCVSATWQRVQQ